MGEVNTLLGASLLLEPSGSSRNHFSLFIHTLSHARGCHKFELPISCVLLSYAVSPVYLFSHLLNFFQMSDDFALPSVLSFDSPPQMDDAITTDADLALDPSTSNIPLIEPIPVVFERHNQMTTQVASNTFQLGSSIVPAAKTIHQPQHRSKDAIRRSEYRKRQKEEKESLRNEIDKLSTKLVKLQDSTKANSSLLFTDAALSSCLWKAIATRQEQRRRAAEKEQVHLRAAILSRAGLIEDLCGFLKKRLYDGTMENDEFGDLSRHKKRMRLKVTDSTLFETFITELYTIYLRTDDVFTACDLSLAAPSLPVAKANKDECGFSQRVSRQILPFNFQQTCCLLWHIAKLKHQEQDRVSYEDVNDPDNIIATKIRISSPRMGEKGEGLFRGMHSDSTGWCIIRPTTNRSTTGTVVETCLRYVPMHLSNSSTRAPVVNEFTELVVEQADEENVSIFKTLEMLLLDDAPATGTANTLATGTDNALATETDAALASTTG
ncbi:unnamed protein product [Peronospora belbahrii]|uniref:BZIP domain-containing protein n=1 Tax=Peronospora belbahrii TaxID=622444 RepID=A0AAU9KZL1_9STRA|nr:unnamed protein product [Peronospora belbahrii]